MVVSHQALNVCLTDSQSLISPFIHSLLTTVVCSFVCSFLYSVVHCLLSGRGFISFYDCESDFAYLQIVRTHSEVHFKIKPSLSVFSFVHPLSSTSFLLSRSLPLWLPPSLIVWLYNLYKKSRATLWYFRCVHKRVPKSSLKQ